MSKRTKFRSLAALVLVVAVLPLVLLAPPQHASQPTATVMKSIEGNSELAPAPQVYTVLAVPQGWKQNAKCTDLVNGFSQKPNMVAMRQQSELKCYSAGHADFQARWQSACPEVAQGQPVVVVAYGEQLLYKRSGASAADVNRDLAGVLERLKSCPCKPRPKPSPDPKPNDDTPQVAPLADTVPANTTPSSEQNFMGLCVLLAVVAGGVTAVGQFKSRMK